MFTEDIKLTVFILLLGLFVIFFLSNIQVVVAQEESPIIFTEIMYDLDGSDDGREWVEVFNNSDTSYNLVADWRFFDGSNHVLNIVQGDEIFEPGETAVIVDNAESFLLDYPDYSGFLIDSVVKLNNTGEEIKLSLDKGETWIAQTEYTSDQGGAGDGYSLEYSNGFWGASVEIGGGPGNYILSEAEEVTCPTNTEEETQDEVLVYEDEVDSNNEEDESVEPIEQENNNSTGSSVVNEIVYSNKVIINEIVPDPLGNDEDGEYIELFNNDSVGVDLSGWWIEDATEKKYVLSNMIESGSYIVIYRLDSKITLNNSSGDEIKLYNPFDELVDKVQYDESVASQSFSRFATEWLWTDNLTPGSENTIPVEVVEETVELEIADEESSTNGVVGDEEVVELELQLISNIKDLELNSEVYTQGVVTVLPGHFAQTYFYISEVDFDGDVNLSVGIQIYSSKKDFIEMSVGDVIVVFGKLSATGGEKRIKLSSIDDMQIIDSLELPIADEILTGEISDDFEGGLISISGDLVDKKSTSWYLDDDSGEIRVYISSKTGITKPVVELGQEVMVLGIVSETKSGFRLLPRFDSDISVEQVIIEDRVEPEIRVISKSEKNVIDVVDNNSNNPEDYLGYGLGVVGLTMLSWVVRLKFF